MSEITKKIASQIMKQADILVDIKQLPEKGDIVRKVRIKVPQSHLAHIYFKSGKQIVVRYYDETEEKKKEEVVVKEKKEEKMNDLGYGMMNQHPQENLDYIK